MHIKEKQLREGKGDSRALEAHLAAAARDLTVSALPWNGAANAGGAAAGLGGWNGVQAIWQHIQVWLGCLEGTLQQLPTGPLQQACSGNNQSLETDTLLL